MGRKFKINPNNELVNKALLLLQKQGFANKYAYNDELNKILNEIFAYKEETFKEAENYLLANVNYVDRVAVILDCEIENVISLIFDRQKQIFTTNEKEIIIYNEK